MIYTYRIVLLAVLLTVPSLASAGGYNPEIDIYVPLHKKTGPAFTARNAVELINSELHHETAKGAKEYRESGDSLGLYYKAFNWVDLTYNTLKFGYNVYNTADIARTRISAIVALLNDYQNEVRKHGIERDDQVILDIGRELYENVSNDVEDIWTTAAQILGFSAVKVPISTYSMLEDMHILNGSLEHIQYSLNRAWGRLYAFMLARLGWRWDFSYTPLERSAIAEGAIGRWREATQRSLSLMSVE